MSRLEAVGFLTFSLLKKREKDLKETSDLKCTRIVTGCAVCPSFDEPS